MLLITDVSPLSRNYLICLDGEVSDVTTYKYIGMQTRK